MVAVIGDVHGCFNTFVMLYEDVKKKYPTIDVYCVGDLIDRGNHSSSVFQFIIDNNIKFVIGNHDQMFHDYYQNPNTEFASMWVYNGHKPTINSYIQNKETLFSHIIKIENAPYFYDLEDCFISHAGVSKKFEVAFNELNTNNIKVIYPIMNANFGEEYGLLWNRDKLLNIGKLQVLGHTKKNDVVFDKDANALYIDTGAYTGNKLTCAIIDKNKLVEIMSKNTHEQDYNDVYIG